MSIFLRLHWLRARRRHALPDARLDARGRYDGDGRRLEGAEAIRAPGTRLIGMGLLCGADAGGDDGEV